MRNLKTFKNFNESMVNESMIKVSSEPIDSIIYRTVDYENRHGGNHMMIELNDDKVKDFLILLNDLSSYTFIDALGGTESKNAFQRYRTDKTFEDVIDYVKPGERAGIKINHNSIGKWNEWEKWEDGFIEGFIRMDGDIEHSEYFIWQYIKMEHLKEILEKFKDSLKYHEF